MRLYNSTTREIPHFDFRLEKGLRLQELGGAEGSPGGTRYLDGSRIQVMTTHWNSATSRGSFRWVSTVPGK